MAAGRDGASKRGAGKGASGARGAGGSRSAANAGAKGHSRQRRGLGGAYRNRKAPSERSQAGAEAQALKGDVIYGRRSVAEALEAGLTFRQAFAAESTHGRDNSFERLVKQLELAGTPVREVPKATLDHLSYRGNHQGILVEVAPFAYRELAELIEASGEGDALIVVLDHVQDEGNLGAIARSAECVGATGLVVANRRAAGVGPGAYKTSAGALTRLPVAQVSNVASAVDELKRAGFWAVAATEHADGTLWETDLGGRICLVMGAEATGVSRLVLERCDEACALPIVGGIESLNVAQAATVFCYEWLRGVFDQRSEG